MLRTRVPRLRDRWAPVSFPVLSFIALLQALLSNRWFSDLLAALNNDGPMAREVSDALDERRAIKANFIRDHPTYYKIFWVFPQKDAARRFC